MSYFSSKFSYGLPSTALVEYGFCGVKAAYGDFLLFQHRGFVCVYLAA